MCSFSHRENDVVGETNIKQTQICTSWLIREILQRKQNRYSGEKELRVQGDLSKESTLRLRSDVGVSQAVSEDKRVQVGGTARAQQ